MMNVLQPAILVDYRERASGLPVQLTSAGLEVRFAQLGRGDYVIGDRVCIERKTTADLDASVMDGRLFEQLPELMGMYERVILLLQDDSPGLLPQESREGAIAWAVRMGASVLHVKSAEAAVRMLVRLAKQEAAPPRESARVAAKPKHPDRLLEHIVRSLPGIGAKTAQALLEEFSSLQMLTQADSLRLQQVAGVGKTRALQLEDLFSRQYREKYP